MRMTILASAAILALSTAAIAQVGQAPEEQKLPANAAMPDDTARPVARATATPVPADPEPGAPSTALVNSVAGPDDQPTGQRPPK